jgi:signal transduction histidine kinase
MLVAIMTFFLLAGVLSLLVVGRLVGFRQTRRPAAVVNVHALDIDELKTLVAEMLSDVRQAGDMRTELQYDVQQIREMVLGDRLAVRDALREVAKQDAELQQSMAEIAAQLRQPESGVRPARAPAFREWLPNPAAAA